VISYNEFQVFKNIVPRKIFKLKRDEETCEWRTLLDKRGNLYSLLVILMAVKSKTKRTGIKLRQECIKCVWNFDTETSWKVVTGKIEEEMDVIILHGNLRK
jgi:hypothetical protein